MAGFNPPKFEKRILDNLVLEPHTKAMILSLTETFIKNLQPELSEGDIREEGGLLMDLPPSRPHPTVDLIRGKGQGLIFLLHGRPGVGKTFTAGSNLFLVSFDSR